MMIMVDRELRVKDSGVHGVEWTMDMHGHNIIVVVGRWAVKHNWGWLDMQINPRFRFVVTQTQAQSVVWMIF